MLKLIRRSYAAIKRSGFRATVLRGVMRPAGLVRKAWGTRLANMASDLEFDRKFHVETGGLIRWTASDGLGENWVNSNFYMATDSGFFSQLVDAVPMEHSNFTFVDLGSGKGRVVLMASVYPFRKIVGVELSDRLHETALRNLQTYRNPGQKCQNIEFLCQDVVDFEIPEGPLVFYLYNPFSLAIMAKVVEKVKGSLLASPRQVIVLHCNDHFGNEWGKITGFKKVFSHASLSAYSNVPVGWKKTG